MLLRVAEIVSKRIWQPTEILRQGSVSNQLNYVPNLFVFIYLHLHAKLA